MGPYFCWYGTTSQASESRSLLITMIHQGFPIILGITTTFIGYMLTLKTTRQLPKELLAYLGFNPNHLLWYPVVFFISFTPSLVHTIYGIYNPQDTFVLIQALHIGLKHPIGFTNALVYGLQRNLYKETENTQDDEYDYKRSDSLFSIPESEENL